MSLASGSITLKRFLSLGPAPEDGDLAAGLAQDRFRPFEDGLDEERMGWVGTVTVGAWDLKAGQLWTTAGSAKAADAVTRLFMKSFGCELQPMGPLVLASRVAPDLPSEALASLDPLDLTVEAA